ICYEGAIDRLVEYLDQHPDVGIVGPKLLNTDGTLQESCRHFMKTWRLILQHGFPWKKVFPRFAERISLAYWDHSYTRSVDWILGAALMIRRECLDQVGLKDESYFIFHEDSDWCFQSWKANWKVVFVHDAQIIHHGSQTVQKLWGGKHNIEVYKAQHNFIRKNLGKSELLMHRAFLTILLYLRWSRLDFAHFTSRVGDSEYESGADFLLKGIHVQLHSPIVDRKPKLDVTLEKKS
ncbi:MAG: glycosyltransferase, partial [bacterium]